MGGAWPSVPTWTSRVRTSTTHTQLSGNPDAAALSGCICAWAGISRQPPPPRDQLFPSLHMCPLVTLPASWRLRTPHLALFVFSMNQWDMETNQHI